ALQVVFVFQKIMRLIAQKVIDIVREKWYISAMLATRISERKRNDFTALSRNAWGFLLQKIIPKQRRNCLGIFH
ncbi:hypothetical protein KZ461_11535, partial [Glaesserella parasuis]|nr:hypothetical protein [Glaesserella parasuis]